MKLLSSNKIRLIATLTVSIFTIVTLIFLEPFTSKAQAQSQLTRICRGKGNICAILGTAVVGGIGKVLGQHIAKESIDYLNKETTLKLCNYTILGKSCTSCCSSSGMAMMGVKWRIHLLHQKIRLIVIQFVASSSNLVYAFHVRSL